MTNSQFRLRPLATAQPPCAVPQASKPAPPRFSKPAARNAVALAAFFLFTLASSSFAQSNTAASLFPDPVVATGKGLEIRRSAVADAFYTEKARVFQQQNVAIPDSERPRIESDILLHLVMDKILVQRATEAEKTNTQAEVANYLNDLRKAAPDESLFQQQIASTGKTLEQFTSAYLEKRLAQVVLARELVPTNLISDAAVKQYYDDTNNAAKFVILESVRVAHILICTLDIATRRPLPADQQKEKERLARDILARAEKGEEFAALVKQYSDDVGTRDAGGEHVFARHGLGLGMDGFEVASFSLKTNQISDLVETPYGYEIIKLLEKKPASKMPLDDIVTATIKEHLAYEEINRQLPVYVPKLEAEYNVKFLDTNYSPTPLLPPAAPGTTNQPSTPFNETPQPMPPLHIH